MTIRDQLLHALRATQHSVLTASLEQAEHDLARLRSLDVDGELSGLEFDRLSLVIALRCGDHAKTGRLLDLLIAREPGSLSGLPAALDRCPERDDPVFRVLHARLASRLATANASRETGIAVASATPNRNAPIDGRLVWAGLALLGLVTPLLIWTADRPSADTDFSADRTWTAPPGDRRASDVESTTSAGPTSEAAEDASSPMIDPAGDTTTDSDSLPESPLPPAEQPGIESGPPEPEDPFGTENALVRDERGDNMEPESLPMDEPPEAPASVAWDGDPKADSLRARRSLREIEKFCRELQLRFRTMDSAARVPLAASASVPLLTEQAVRFLEAANHAIDAVRSDARLTAMEATLAEVGVDLSQGAVDPRWLTPPPLGSQGEVADSDLLTWIGGSPDLASPILFAEAWIRHCNGPSRLDLSQYRAKLSDFARLIAEAEDVDESIARTIRSFQPREWLDRIARLRRTLDTLRTGYASNDVAVEILERQLTAARDQVTTLETLIGATSPDSSSPIMAFWSGLDRMLADGTPDELLIPGGYLDLQRLDQGRQNLYSDVQRLRELVEALIELFPDAQSSPPGQDRIGRN